MGHRLQDDFSHIQIITDLPGKINFRKVNLVRKNFKGVNLLLIEVENPSPAQWSHEQIIMNYFIKGKTKAKQKLSIVKYKDLSHLIIVSQMRISLCID